MPKVAKKLNASELKTINVDGSHAVGGVSGLFYGLPVFIAKIVPKVN